jgi:hypothetical protein
MLKSAIGYTGYLFRPLADENLDDKKVVESRP